MENSAKEARPRLENGMLTSLQERFFVLMEKST